MSRNLKILVLLIVGALVLAACGDPAAEDTADVEATEEPEAEEPEAEEPEAEEEPEATEEEPEATEEEEEPEATDEEASEDYSAYTVGWSQANNGDVWRINQTNNVEDTCAEIMPGVNVVSTDGGGDDAKQVADVADLVSQGVDVILLTPNTADPLTPAAEDALAAGIPVITLDRSVNTEVTQHIGADNKLIGSTAAQYVAETLLEGNGGNVIEIQGTLGASATIDRHDEFVATLESDYPEVEIIESQTANYRLEDAVTFMNDMLARYAAGDYDIVYTHNDQMALGAIQALEDAGRLGEAHIVGIDGENAAYDAIADGRMAVTFTYDNAGKEACESAKRLIDGEEIDPQWVLETNTVDETNAAEFQGTGF